MIMGLQTSRGKGTHGLFWAGSPAAHVKMTSVLFTSLPFILFHKASTMFVARQESEKVQLYSGLNTEQ